MGFVGTKTERVCERPKDAERPLEEALGSESHCELFKMPFKTKIQILIYAPCRKRVQKSYGIRAEAEINFFVKI